MLRGGKRDGGGNPRGDRGHRQYRKRPRSIAVAIGTVWEQGNAIRNGNADEESRLDAVIAEATRAKASAEARKTFAEKAIPNAQRRADFARRRAAEAIRERQRQAASAKVEAARAELSRALERTLPAFMIALSELAGTDENFRDRRGM
jgi:hypothetical protein